MPDQPCQAQDLIRLGFDRYQRFRLAVELINQEAAGQALSILDVGSFDNAFAPFAAQHNVTPWTDLISPQNGGLPLADDSFDLVLSLDVLEHVPQGDRHFFLSELGRVANRACLIGFPVKAAAEAEDFVLTITGSPWLAQHKELGLPDPAEVEKIFQSLNWDFTCHANAALPSWTAMMLLMYGVSEPLRGDISAFFNKHYYAMENRMPAYRHIYLCRKKPA